MADDKILKFTWKDFSQLSAQEVYEVLGLRQQVFMLEQQSLYTDIDFHDQQAMHLLVSRGGRLGGYLRIRQLDSLAKIERIVLLPEYRGTGTGQQMVEAALAFIRHNWQVSEVKLSAQCVAAGFYQKFGFSEQGEPYDDGGILHIDMQMPLKS